MSAAAAPLLLGGPPGWLVFGVITVATVGAVYVMSETGDDADKEADEQLKAGADTGSATCTGDCGPEPDCDKRGQDVERALRKVRKRHEEMKKDVFGMRSGASPKGQGDWDGHVQAFLQAQNNLKKKLKRLKAGRCAPIPEAETWAEKDPPQ